MKSLLVLALFVASTTFAGSNGCPDPALKSDRELSIAELAGLEQNIPVFHRMCEMKTEGQAPCLHELEIEQGQLTIGCGPRLQEASK